jgi:hypothetical protein
MATGYKILLLKKKNLKYLPHYTWFVPFTLKGRNPVKGQKPKHERIKAVSYSFI